VIAFTLAIALIAKGHLPYPLVAELNDQLEIDGVRMTNPTDAVYVGGVLYVADMNEHTIFVQEADGRLTRFGRAGSGPGEFQHHPVQLLHRNQTILVVEFNSLFTSTFRLDGTFQERVKRGHGPPPWDKRQVRQVTDEEVPDTGFMLHDTRHDCYFSGPAPHGEHGIHLGRGLILEDSQGLLYVIKKAGVVEVYERPCHLLHTMNIPLARFKADVKPHHVMRKIMRARYKEDRGPVFVHGKPVIGAATAGPDRVWLLVKDEHLEKGPYYQQVQTANTWLFEVDPTVGKVRFVTELDQPVRRVRYWNGHLILISGYEATVRLYRVRGGREE